jgi:hypothetical protein
LTKSQVFQFFDELVSHVCGMQSALLRSSIVCPTRENRFAL